MTSKKLGYIESTLICPICTEKVPSLQAHVQSSHTEQEIQDAIFREKAKGVPDIEIGCKYGVHYRYIERLITHREGVNISQLGLMKKVKSLAPRDFHEEQTAVWSFKSRGNWATHSGEYRGNWSPYIPRNVILKYSKEGETVLDYFCGAGTTAVEAKLLGRKCIAFDINDAAIELAKENVAFDIDRELLKRAGGPVPKQIYEPDLFVGDARDLSFLPDNSIDLICAHPPYANIIHYTPGKEGDLSFLEVSPFLEEMRKIAQESFRVLKSGHQCAILIGDTRQKKHVVPMGFKLINVYLDTGFRLRELVIKRQHNCKTTGFWYANSIKYNFLLLAHEYLPIFEKPTARPTNPQQSTRRVMPSRARLSSKKLSKLESTTVWIFPRDEFEACLNRNVLRRYADNKQFEAIKLELDGRKKEFQPLSQKQVRKELLFIKSPCLDSEKLNQKTLNFYVEEVKRIVKERAPTIVPDGFCVIQTKDVRVNGCIEPLAKRIVDALSLDNLWLKEVIVATYESLNSRTQISRDHLGIAHQYLLVYKVRK